MPTQRDQTEKSKVSNQTAKLSGSNVNWNEVEKARADIKDAFGFVPGFVGNLVDSSIPGAWAEAKALRFSNDTALDTKLKGLISIGVSSQIPCEMLTEFEQTATLADGATRTEQLEAVMMAAISRHWSTVLNGAQIDKAEFKKEVEQVMSYVKKMMADAGGKMPPAEIFLVKPTTYSEAYEDMMKTLGMVPTFFKVFPKEAIAGAWSEFKGLQLNPYTSLTVKQKELIGVAVAAQIPCEYCIIFHKSVAALNGASEREIQEAIAMSALTRHWSALFHGPQMEFAAFKKDAAQMVKYSSQHRLQ